MARGGKAELDVAIKGDASGVTKATSQASSSLKSLENSTKSLGDAFQQALSGKFGSAVTSAKAGFSELSTAAGSSGSLIGLGIGAGVATAGVAIGKFALDGANKFEDLALHVSAFSKATGLSTQEASKFVEVAKDLKIDPSTFEGALVKMEKGISANRKAFGDLVVTAKDGSVDITATFLRVVQHLQSIKDPLDRAAESSKLFGKGFANISEIIGTSADDLSKRLDEVSQQTGKIITPEEVAKAEQYRDAMDKFHDSVENLQISIGQGLVPVLTSAANAAGSLVTAVDKFGSIKLPDWMVKNQAGATIGTVVKGVIGLVPPLRALAGVSSDGAKATNDMNQATADQIAVTAGMTTKAQLYEATVASGNATMKDQAGAFRAAEESSLAWQAALSGTTDSLDRLGAANDHDISSTEALAAQHRAAADAANAQRDALLGLTDIVNSVDNAQLQYAQAQQAANDAMKVAAKGGKDQALHALEAKVAIDQQVAAAKALAQQNADLTGSAKGSDKANKAFLDTLRFLAAQAKGPAKAALDSLIAGLQGVGKQHPKPTVGVNDQATSKANAIKANVQAIGLLSVAATINATGDAIAKLQEAIRLGQQFAGSSYTADVSVGKGKRAAGGPVAESKTYVVGEKGPELFVPSMNGTIIPNDRLRFHGSTPVSGGSTVILNFNGLVTDPVAVGREVKKVVAAAERAGVR